VLSGEAHVRAVAAAQPFVSGAISKTCNLPSSASREDVAGLYRLAWASGLKAVAVFRDGAKGSQPLTVGPPAAGRSAALSWGDRVKMPDERNSVTRKFCLEGHDFYFHVGLVGGRPMELFIKGSAKEGTLVGGLLDQLGVAISLALQHGVPLAKLVEKMIGTSFEPSGWTGDPEFPYARSCLDAFAQWARARWPGAGGDDAKAEALARPIDISGRQCPKGCGPMSQDGTCWRCDVCGASSGGCGG
jgi:ribonucleoside-diphosphate reductase alpha chain